MALSRIWSAFIIIAITVAGFKYLFSNDQQIYSRMVVGKADDPYDSVSYYMIGKPENAGYTSRESFAGFVSTYGFYLTDSANPGAVVVTDNLDHDSVKLLQAADPTLKVYTYRSLQSRLVKKA